MIVQQASLRSTAKNLGLALAHPKHTLACVLRHKLKRALALGMPLLAFFLVACTSTDFSQTRPASEYFHKAMDALEEKKSADALLSFEALIERHPPNAYTRQAYLELIHIHYESRNYASMQTIAERFLTFYENDPRADYAFYMRAVAIFQQQFPRFDRYLYTNQSLRDFEEAESAYQNFSGFMQRYPQSAYIPLARQYILYLRNRLAQRELLAAQNYLATGNYLAAQNRGKLVIKEYAFTPSVNDALNMLIEIEKTYGTPAQVHYYESLLPSHSQH